MGSKYHGSGIGGGHLEEGRELWMATSGQALTKPHLLVRRNTRTADPAELRGPHPESVTIKNNKIIGAGSAVHVTSSLFASWFTNDRGRPPSPGTCQPTTSDMRREHAGTSLGLLSMWTGVISAAWAVSVDIDPPTSPPTIYRTQQHMTSNDDKQQRW